MSGILYGIGIGPGDPELITVKGLRLLRAAKHVFVPATRPGHSYAHEIAGCYVDTARQTVTELICPPLRDREAVAQCWQTQAAIVAQMLADGTAGAFLAEGDPSLYSTFQYLAAALRSHHPQIAIVTVAGVSSVSAAAALAGIPLAQWDERVTILPAPYERGALAHLIDAAGSAVLLKVGRVLPELLDELAQDGTSLERVLVRRAGRPEQEILCDEAAMRAQAPDYFSILLVRKSQG